MRRMHFLGTPTLARDNRRPLTMSFMERDEAHPSSRARVALGRRKNRPDGERLYFRQGRYRSEGTSSKSVDEGYKSTAAITNFRASDLINNTEIRNEQRV